MTVTAIESVTRHKMRVSLDGEPAFVFTDREIREWNLTEEMEFDRAEEEALVQYVCREAARTAMNLLVKRDYAQAELYRKLSAVSSKFLQMEMEYLGSVPHDFKLQNAVMRQEPVTIAYPNAPASKAISRIARQIINQPANTPGAFTAKGLSGLFARMFRNGQR